jgi:type IV pilus assembly protein PilA
MTRTSLKTQNRGFTLIEILVVIGLIAILAAIVLIAINPGRQFAQARNTQRTSNAETLLNGIGQYTADHKGDLPTVPAKGAAAVEVGKTLCLDLVPTYLPSLPTDPGSSSDGASLTDCNDAVAGAVRYFVAQDNNGRITISAPDTEQPPASEDVSITR